MRIISGNLKGKKLISPPDKKIRPTSDKIKEALFNILNISYEDLKVLDIFAGSGSLGIEALSRGAREVTFVESSGKGFDVLKKNVYNCGLEDRARLIKGDVYNSIKKMAKEKETFDLVLADPPYELGWLKKLLSAKNFFSIVETEGLVVFEHSVNENVFENSREMILDFEILKQKKYGSTKLSIIKKRGDAS